MWHWVTFSITLRTESLFYLRSDSVSGCYLTMGEFSDMVLGTPPFFHDSALVKPLFQTKLVLIGLVRLSFI